jgi:hypothetical protein
MKIPIVRAPIAIVAFADVAGALGRFVDRVACGVRVPRRYAASYKAADYDTRLTPSAHEARPIIQSLDRYYQAHGQCPRPSDGDFDEIRSSLPAGLIATLRDRQIEFRDTKAISGWSYDLADNDPTACQLWRKLGWDPALTWRRHGAETKWIFARGDGSDEKAIDLDIGG